MFESPQRSRLQTLAAFGLLGALCLWFISMPLAFVAYLLGYATRDLWITFSVILGTLSCLGYGPLQCGLALTTQENTASKNTLLVRAIAVFTVALYILFLYEGFQKNTIHPRIFLPVLYGGTLLITLFIIAIHQNKHKLLNATALETIVVLWITVFSFTTLFIEQNNTYFQLSTTTIRNLQTSRLVFNACLFVVPVLWNEHISPERRRTYYGLLGCIIIAAGILFFL